MLPNAERQRIIAALEELPANVRGDDVPQLVAYIEEALFAAPIDDRLIGLSPADAAARQAEQASIEQALLRIAKEARSILPPVRGTPEDDAAVALAPWKRFVSPFLSAAMRLRHAARSGNVPPRPVRLGRNIPRSPTSGIGNADDLRQALELLASLTKPPAKRGAPYDVGPGSALVRAVCLYVSQQQGLALSFVWREEDKAKGTGEKGRRGGARARRGDTLPTTNRTVELIAQSAKAFGLEVDNSSLRTHLSNYKQQLQATGRDTPNEADLFGSLLEDKPKRAKAKAPKKTLQ